MDAESIVLRLRGNILTFQGLTLGMSEDQARWKPEPDQWSVLEVVNHLADEELLDFRTRLDLTLHRSPEAWPPIDPTGWVVDRGYNDRGLVESMSRFTAERDRSLTWLEGLEDPDWEQAHEHASFGPIKAGDLMAAWLAHDLIHVRQINRLHRQWLEAVSAAGYSPRYAGRW